VSASYCGRKPLILECRSRPPNNISSDAPAKETEKGKNVEFTGPLKDQRWGLVTAIKVPGGGEVGLYEPRHPTALNLKS
jgi:hypothetical protein